MRILLLTIATVLFSISLTAQNNIDDANFDDSIKYSIFYGINYSYVENYGNDGFKGERSGYNAGLVAEMPFAKRWSFEGSLFFSTVGEQPIDEEGERVARFRTYTINLPVQFKYYFSDKKDFSIHIGPNLSYNFEPRIFENRNQDFRTLEEIVRTGFDGTAGFGYKFPGFGLWVKGTFSYGFADIFVNTDVYQSERFKIIRFDIGYQF
ncbi:MAG: porin family protein [Nonlabens sp.]